MATFKGEMYIGKYSIHGASGLYMLNILISKCGKQHVCIVLMDKVRRDSNQLMLKITPHID